MAANIMLFSRIGYVLGWFVYFKIQDRKEENNNKQKNEYLWDVSVRIIPFLFLDSWTDFLPGSFFCAWFFSWAACSLA